MRQALPLPQRPLGLSYLEVLKPRETSLITFIGMVAAWVAASGQPSWGRFLLVTVVLILGSGGCNGLTNYLDRELDAKMERTRHRALPSARIHPAEKALAWAGFLTALGLALAWLLTPWAFLAGVIGIIAAVVLRKGSATHLLGAISGVSPLMVGWLAFRPPDLSLLLLSLLVFLWVPLHVWSLMLSYREDYTRAGVHIFPLTWKEKDAIKVLLGLTMALFLVSLALSLVAGWGGLYLGAALLLSLTLLWANYRLLQNPGASSTWKLYKLATFPYLGILFLVIGVEVWL